jgi:CHRD domain
VDCGPAFALEKNAMKNVTVCAAAGLALVLAAPALAQDKASGAKLSTTLSGANEVPSPADLDGSGSFSATVNPGLGKLCYKLTVSNIATPLAAHIHEAVAGVNGPVLITLATPTSGSSEACVEVSREQALEFIKTPSDYYVNVHNADFPGGAVRGQLSR